MAIFFSPAGTCSLRSFPRFPQPSRLLWPELFCLKITLQKHHSSLWPPQRASSQEQIKLPGHFKCQGKHFLCTQFSDVTWSGGSVGSITGNSSSHAWLLQVFQGALTGGAGIYKLLHPQMPRIQSWSLVLQIPLHCSGAGSVAHTWMQPLQ